MLSHCKSNRGSTVETLSSEATTPTRPTPAPRHVRRKNDYVNAEILQHAYIADQTNVVRKKSFKPIPSVRKKYSSNNSAVHQNVDVTDSGMASDKHALLKSDSISSTDSHDYDNEIPKLRKQIVIRDGETSDSVYCEAQPVDPSVHKPLELAFSNPTSEDDGVRIPAHILSRLSVESI